MPKGKATCLVRRSRNTPTFKHHERFGYEQVFAYGQISQHQPFSRGRFEEWRREVVFAWCDKFATSRKFWKSPILKQNGTNVSSRSIFWRDQRHVRARWSRVCMAIHFHLPCKQCSRSVVFLRIRTKNKKICTMPWHYMTPGGHFETFLMQIILVSLKWKAIDWSVLPPNVVFPLLHPKHEC